MAGEIAVAVAGGVAAEGVKESTNWMFDFIQRQISYVFKYQRYIDNLKNQVEDLGNARERVKHQVEEAERQGDEIEKDVRQWLQKVNELTEGVVKPIYDDEDEANKRCFMRLCPNLIKRYRLSKKAAKATQDSDDLLGKGNFNCVSYRPFPMRTRSMYKSGYESFDSRRPVLQEIMQALADTNINMIGVYGMGGVGKTTLVSKVASEAQETKLFDIVVMATVTEAPDLKRIQAEIAEQLGLVFREETESGRADRLRNRLKKEKGKVLVILDNIWTKLDLKAVGIPIGHDEKEIVNLQSLEKEKTNDQRPCKILLTSRKQDLLNNHMNTQKNFKVGTLSPQEAENFFRNIIGDLAEDCTFQPIASEITRICAGLPLAISVTASALKNKEICVWRDTLDKLKRPNPRRNIDVEETLYSTIELSYNNLESDELKLLFLLCGILHLGPQLGTEFLLTHGAGLNLFQDVHTLEGRRNRVCTLIDDLRASCLLLDGDNYHYVKMHDIVLLVAKSIAIDRHMFTDHNVTGLKELLKEKIPKNSTAVSLASEDVDNELPDKLEFPKLGVFHFCMKDLLLQIPGQFFEGMKELKVLLLYQIRLSQQPSSLGCLMNLQTLFLSKCSLGDIAVIGELKKLEILSIWGSDIEQLPKKIGELTRLRLLNLSNCLKLKVITPNVISRLCRLEELYIINSFVEWENEGEAADNASLVELKRLPHLTALQIHVKDAKFLPHDVLFEKLKSFTIFIGLVWDKSSYYDRQSRMLKLKLNNSTPLGHSIKFLLRRAEHLYLDELNGLRNIHYELDGEGFPQLKLLHVQNGRQLSYIMNSVEWHPCKIVFPMLESLLLYDLINLEKICHGQLYAESFSKLRIIKIRKCDRLECLFSFSMAENLLQLRELEVIDCKNLREIFGQEILDHVQQAGRSSKIELTCLHSITLKLLPQLKSFGFEMETPLMSQASFASRSKKIIGEEAAEDSIALFSQKVVLPRLENLKLSLINIGNIWLDQQPSKMFQSLKSLTVERCHGLKFLFTFSMIQSLVQLQKLVLDNCKSMEEVVDTDGVGGEKKIIFHKLSYMGLKGLPKLTTFGTGDLVEFPSMNTLSIESCPNLKTFFSGSSYANADTLSKNPEEINLENSGNDYIHPLFDEKVAFPMLETLKLVRLDNLQLIWQNRLYPDSFCKLKELTVEDCENIVTIVPSSTHGLPNFQNLQTLIVYNCWSMKSLFPVSVATRLMQLKNLIINSCGLEDIVAAEEREGVLKFVFPQLKSLFLIDLSNLRSFYPGLHTAEWPKLKELYVDRCHNMEIFASESLSFQKREGKNHPKFPFQQPLFLLEKVTPNLEMLSLNSNDINLICLGNFPAEMFSKVKTLNVVCFHDESSVFPFGFLQRFNGLEELLIRNGSFKELFPCEGLNEKKLDVGLKPIRSLRLGNLPCLEHIWKQDSQVDAFLQNLETLEIWMCDTLTYLMPSSVSFKNLTTLDAWSCSGLQHILACSTAKSLVQLTTMKIRKCKSVTEVIANEVDRKEEEIVFGKLKLLELHCLSSLACFCSANYAINFPCLEEVIVSQCPKFKIFCQGVLSTPKLNRVQPTKEMDEEYFWKDDLNSTIQQMFTDMVGFRHLEYLRVSEFPTLAEKIWNGQIPVSLFCNLKSLVLDEFSDILSVIPSNLLCYLEDLETLEVRDSDSLKEVFGTEGQLNADGYRWKKNHEDILGFSNLKSLKVYNCNSLRYMLTPSQILGLVQLQEIEIRNCALIEEVITKTGEKNAAIDKIQIPQLKSIILDSLPNLTRFYSGINTLECPPLKFVEIKDCPKIYLKDHLASSSREEVALPSLDNFSLSSIISGWILTNKPSAASSCFQNLTELIIHGCDYLKHFVTSSMVNSLVQLKKLEICNCKFIEGIIVQEEERIRTMLFPKLEELKLFDLPRLARFCSFTGNIVELSSLLELCIINCPSMKTFISNFICYEMTSSKEPEETNSEKNLHTHMQPLFDKQVRLSNLERLYIKQLDELEKLWDDQLSLDFDCKLTELDVRSCNKLVNIFPYDMIGIVQKLQLLVVENCDSLEEIFHVFEKSPWMVEKNFTKDETVPTFVFHKLTKLYLKKLPSLKSLYPGIHITEWPVLKELVVHGCDKLEIFASEIFLSSEETHGESQHEIPIQHPLFLVNKDAFPSLEVLQLVELPRLLHVWRENSEPSNALQNLRTLKVEECGNLETFCSSSVSFENLTSLEVSKCDALRYLLTLSKAKTLVKLTSMNVTDCEMMENIIAHLGEEVKEDLIVFEKLNDLKFDCLASLTSFCYGDCTLEFPSLVKVIVRQCLKMETFSHGVLSTPRLQNLQFTEGEDDEVEECWQGNLNSTTQQLFKKTTQSSNED